MTPYLIEGLGRPAAAGANKTKNQVRYVFTRRPAELRPDGVNKKPWGIPRLFERRLRLVGSGGGTRTPDTRIMIPLL